MRRLPRYSLASVAIVLIAGSSVAAQTPKDNPAKFREMFVKLDANGDTVLERDEMPVEGRAAFDRLIKRGDANENGKLELEELRALGKKVAVPNDPSITATAVLARFQRMDKDGDGKVARAEFTGVPANFDRMDADKDGALSKEEITKSFASRPAAAGAASPKVRAKARAEAKTKVEASAKPKDDAKKEVAKPATDANKADRLQRFTFLDKDGDGKISKGEFPREKLFDRLDADGDGFLSSTELAKFRKLEE